ARGSCGVSTESLAARFKPSAKLVRIEPESTSDSDGGNAESLAPRPGLQQARPDTDETSSFVLVQRGLLYHHPPSRAARAWRAAIGGLPCPLEVGLADDRLSTRWDHHALYIARLGYHQDQPLTAAGFPAVTSTALYPTSPWRGVPCYIGADSTRSCN